MSAYDFRRLESLADVAPLRAGRMASLTALPEFFVESRVRRSGVYAIERDGVAGYLTVLDGRLTELFLAPEHRTHADAVLQQAVASLGLRRAWATTFDPVALAACTSVPRPFVVLGYSFRAMNDVALRAPDSLPSERVATIADVDRVARVSHPDVFEDAAELAEWVGAGRVTLFELRGEIAGFGLCTPTGPETPACDVGVCVSPPHQRRGLGAWIVRRMAVRARSLALVPTAGCASDNFVSRRTLERAGFVADHRLLEFEL